jgi:hypothetical protein
MSVQVTITTITPAEAEALLKANTRNRNISERAVNDLARAMTNGEWTLNGEAVKIAEDGTVLDGQHRLEGCVKSGVAIEVLLVTGLPVQAQDTMDLGRKRTTADAWKIHGETNVNVLAAVARKAWMWDMGNIKFTPHNAPTPGELRQYLEDNSSLRRSAEIGTRVNGHFRPASATVTGVAHHLFHRIDPGVAAEFFAQLETGAKLDIGYPVLTLRDRLMRDRASMKKPPFYVNVAYFIRSWNAVREGRELSTIIQTAESFVPKPV